MDFIRVAALFVETNGVYFGLPNVDPWDVHRDAMEYRGPYPVVAHPPCERWCKMAKVNEARYGQKVGDDKGRFAFAIDCVRRYGGVLEHPKQSLAWPAFGLKTPQRGKWIAYGHGFVTEIYQSAYGHRARKATWLYTINVPPIDLNWTAAPFTHRIGYRKSAVNESQFTPTLNRAEAHRTPIEFRDLMLTLARAATLNYDC